MDNNKFFKRKQEAFLWWIFFNALVLGANTILGSALINYFQLSPALACRAVFVLVLRISHFRGIFVVVWLSVLMPLILIA